MRASSWFYRFWQFLSAPFLAITGYILITPAGIANYFDTAGGLSRDTPSGDRFATDYFGNREC